MAAFSRMTALSCDREFFLYHHVFVVVLAVSHFGFGLVLIVPVPGHCLFVFICHLSICN